MVLAIAASALFSPGVAVVIGVLTFSGWVSYQRVVRAQTKVLLGSAFVEASRSIGGNRWWIARKHLLPNAIGPVIVIATQQVAAVILFESALSYLGLGVPADTVTLGGMVSAGGSDAGRLVGACLAGGSDRADRAEFEPDWRRVAATDRSKAASVVYSERKEN